MTRLVRLFCILFTCAALGGCGGQRYRIPAMKLRTGTSIERRATLSILRRAWLERPREICPDGNLYERTLINRASLFGRRIKETETHRPACNFWMDCVREHIANYDEDAHKFRN